MAKSFLPDPLELLRQAVNRLDGRSNTTPGRGLDIDQVLKTVQQMSGLSLVLRQAVEVAFESASKRLNLPSRRDFADMQATLQRLEDKLDSLLDALAVAAPRPSRTSTSTSTRTRTRKPVAEQRAAKPTQKAAAPTRRRKAS